MNGIEEFVLAGGQKITARAIQEFRQKLPFLLVKAETLESAAEAPHLAAQTRFLARYVEDVVDGAFAAQDLHAVTESVFALGYLLRDVDIIPDCLPGKGYTDDSAIVRCVLRSHQQEFERYSRASGSPMPTLAA